MKELEKEIKGRGEVKSYNFTQLCANGYAYVYEVTNDECDTIHYEVFERKENTQFDCVSYPRAKAFGVWAFSKSTIDRAMIEYDRLSQVVKNKLDKRDEA